MTAYLHAGRVDVGRELELAVNGAVAALPTVVLEVTLITILPCLIGAL